MKTLPFENAKALEGKFDRIRRDCDGLTYVNPKYLDFFHSFQKLFLFNNEKNEEFDVYPIRVWNMSDYQTYARKHNPKQKGPQQPFYDNTGQSSLAQFQSKQAEAYCDEFIAYNLGSEFFQW